jgi:membrane protein DedA with SNARE-associated domain
MPRGRFLAFNAVGAACWALVMLGGGNVVGTLPLVAEHVGLVIAGVATVSLMPVLVPAAFSAAHR